MLIAALWITGNAAVIPSGHWGHLPGLHQRRVGQCPHVQWEMGVVVLELKMTYWVCCDDNPIMTKFLQYGKVNGPSLWLNQMETCTFECDRKKVNGEERETYRWADLRSGVCVWECVCVGVGALVCNLGWCLSTCLFHVSLCTSMCVSIYMWSYMKVGRAGRPCATSYGTNAHYTLFCFFFFIFWKCFGSVS